MPAAPAAVLFVFAALWLPKSGPYQPPTPSTHATIFDTSLIILRALVSAGDTRLGFPDTAAMRGARIDLNLGYSLYYAVKDSTTKDGFVYLGRKIFPVYGRDTFVHSAITFDSTSSGWVPVEFDEGSVIRHFVKYDSAYAARIEANKIVTDPSLAGEYLIATDTGGNETAVMNSEEMEILHELPHSGSGPDMNALPLPVLMRDLVKLQKSNR